jgi:acyl carrier protein
MSAVLLDQVRQIGADIFNVTVDEVTAETSPATVASWDSLQHLNLVLALEQAFDVEFAPEEIEQMVSVGQIVSLVEEKLP